jgi:hypothetical protein
MSDGERASSYRLDAMVTVLGGIAIFILMFLYALIFGGVERFLDFKKLVAVLCMVALMTFLSACRIAIERNEFPILRFSYYIVPGILFGGLLMGFVGTYFWQRAGHQPASDAAFGVFFAIGGAIGIPIALRWGFRKSRKANVARDGGEPFFSKLNRLLEKLSAVRGRTTELVKAVLGTIVGAASAYWAWTRWAEMANTGLKIFMVLAGLFAAVAAWQCFRTLVALLAGRRGLENEKAHGAARKATQAEAKARAGGATEQPPWADHGYSD